ncbi:MAG: hypothetical protein K0B01_09490 [Syntrophobacterales bacterium]|nr:hypothetical protein [Syntrophobacterales bacterium]
MENQDAEFAGVLAAFLDPIVFYNQYADYLNIDVDAIALFDMQGTTITSWINHNNVSQKFLGTDIRTIPLFSALRQNVASGGGRRTHEDAETIISTFQLSGFPFQIAVSYSKKKCPPKMASGNNPLPYDNWRNHFHSDIHDRLKLSAKKTATKG